MPSIVEGETVDATLVITLRLFVQMKQVLSIFRLKNMAQTCSIDSGPYPDISETELLILTSEGRVSPPASLNLTTSSLDNAAPPSPLCISFAGKFQGEELCSPKASTLGSELGLEPDSRVLDTAPPPAKGTPQLSPMELFPHLFPKVRGIYCLGEHVGYAFDVLSLFYLSLDKQMYFSAITI